MACPPHPEHDPTPQRREARGARDSPSLTTRTRETGPGHSADLPSPSTVRWCRPRDRRLTGATGQAEQANPLTGGLANDGTSPAPVELAMRDNGQ